MAWLLRGARDAYFSVGIWVLADSLRLLFGEWDFVGGSRGLVMDASAVDPDSFNTTLYSIAFALAALTLSECTRCCARALGSRSWRRVTTSRALRASASPSRATGLMAFLLSAAICGFGGAVYYLSILYVDPTGAFDLDWQIRLLFIVIVGGVGTVEGPIVGTILYFGLRESMRDAGDLYLIVQGASTAVIMILAPEGLWGLVQTYTRWRLFPVSWATR